MDDTAASLDVLRLQERLTGALIGIARAVDGNEHLIAGSTDQIVREGLAATLPGTALGSGSLAALLREAESEKRRLVPHCYECAAPCGKNSDYDTRRLYAAEEEAGSLKLLLLCGIRGMAARACRAAALGREDREVNRFFYRALFAAGEESFGTRELLPVAAEFGKMDLRCAALLTEAPREPGLP